jgi:uncharacterized repeat protein (TIGR02543 family)
MMNWRGYMMRTSKIFRKLRLMLLVAFVLAMMLPQNTMPEAAAAEVSATSTETYYVDYSSGNDTNNGTSPQTAWKTLDKVNATQFGPGNQLLFKSGEIWFGQLWPKGSGVEGSPIVINSYGTGDKPKIDAEGLIQSAVKLDNQEYWEINNLAVTNWRTTKTTVQLTTNSTFDVTGYLAGIRVTASGREGAYKHIVIRDCYIHDINGLREFGPTDTTGGTVAGAYSNPPVLGGYDSSWFKGTGGISIATVDTRPGYTGAQPPKTYFDGITIENNTIERVSETGIRIAQGVTLAAYSNANQTAVVPNRNIVMKNNLLMGGLEYSDFGQLISPAYAPVSEYNIAHDWRTSGLEVTNTTDGIFQFNEVYDINHWSTTRTADDTAFDADLNSSNVIFQYNYVHDAGSAFLICDLQGNKTTYKPIIYRYNIAQNITNRLIYGGYGGIVYNNTFYSPDNDTRLSPDNNTTISNNIFFVKSLVTGGGIFKNNLYYLTAPIAADTTAVVGNPQFMDPGKGETGTVPGQPKIDTLAGYKLRNTSPAIDTGTPIADNGGRDYFGNPLYLDAPDIGAHEYSELDKPVDHVAYVELDMYKRYMNVQDTGTIKATVKPDSVKNKFITYTSSDDSIVQVTQSGLLTAISPGTARIRATSQSDPTIFVECEIVVSTASNGIKIVTPSDDGYVRGVNVSQSSIVSQTADPNNLQIQNNANTDDGWNKKVLLQFPTTDIKENLDNKTFIFRIFAHKIEAVSPSDARGPYKPVSIFPTNTGWSESTLKGNNRPTRSQTASIGSFNVPVTNAQVYSWFEVNVTDYMRTYLASGNTSQVSFELSNELVRANTDSKFIEFSSKESSDNMPPQLVVSSIPIQVPTGLSVTTTMGTIPVLPTTVTAVQLADGSQHPVTVQWEAINPSLYASKGTFEVRGTINEPAYASLDIPVIIKVTVEPKVLSVTLDANKMYLNVGAVKTVTSHVMPDSVSNKSVTFTSSNNGIASVSADGNITAIAAGTAIITAASVSDSTIMTTCDVTVTAATADYPKQVFKATQDDYVRDRTNVENFGTDSFIHVKSANQAGFARIGYVQFNISAFPSNSTLSAKLKLYGKNIDANSKISNVGVYETDSGWSETTLNWTNRKLFKGSALASFIAPTIPGTGVQTAQGVWYEVDVTNFINSRLQAGLSLSDVSVGLAYTEFVNNNLSPSSTFNSGIQFSSKEDTSGDLAPRLELTVIPYSVLGDKTVRTSIGISPTLPLTVDVRDTTTGLTTPTPVTWEGIPAFRYANPLSFDVQGTFDYNGQSQSVIYNVTVETPATQLLLNADIGIVSPSVSSVTYGNTVGWLPTPVKAGYEFVGWNTVIDGTGMQYHPLTVYMQYTDTILYAQWKSKVFTIRYDAQGGAPAPADQAVKFNTNIGALPTVTREVYTFSGWNTAADGTGETYTSLTTYTRLDNLVIYAQWSVGEFALHFDANGSDDLLADKMVSYQTAVGILHTPSRVGYTFKGWNTASNGTGNTYLPTTIYQTASDTTLYAIWQADTYVLNYDAQGGTLNPNSVTSVTYDTYVGQLPMPTRVGYTFIEWNTLSNGSGEPFTSQTWYHIASNTILHAIWQVIDQGGGSTTGGDTYTPSGTATEITEPIMQDKVELSSELEKDTTVTSDRNGNTVTQVKIDATNMKKTIDNLKDGATVVLSPTLVAEQEGSGFQVNLQIEQLSVFTDKQLSLELRTGNYVYMLSAEEMLEQAKILFPNISPSQIALTIVNRIPSDQEAAAIQLEAKKQGYTLLDSPVSFEVRLSANQVDKLTEMFQKMVGRVLGVTTNKDVIALRLQKDGTFVPVPLTNVNGKYVGMSLLNSTYVLAAARQNTFNDIQGHEAEKRINTLASKYVVNGLPDGNFEPNRSVTRAEFVQMLTAALGLYDKGVAKQRFEDVDVKAWYADAVTRAVEAKLISGVSEVSFNPNGNITHEEVYTILGKTLPILSLSSKSNAGKSLDNYKDAILLSDWSVKQTAELVEIGIIQGVENKLDVKQLITRADAVVFIERLLEKAFK